MINHVRGDYEYLSKCSSTGPLVQFAAHPTNALSFFLVLMLSRKFQSVPWMVMFYSPLELLLRFVKVGVCVEVVVITGDVIEVPPSKPAIK